MNGLLTSNHILLLYILLVQQSLWSGSKYVRVPGQELEILISDYPFNVDKWPCGGVDWPKFLVCDLSLNDFGQCFSVL